MENILFVNENDIVCFDNGIDDDLTISKIKPFMQFLRIHHLLLIQLILIVNKSLNLFLHQQQLR